jgi:hypothetical protein
MAPKIPVNATSRAMIRNEPTSRVRSLKFFILSALRLNEEEINQIGGDLQGGLESSALSLPNLWRLVKVWFLSLCRLSQPAGL